MPNPKPSKYSEIIIDSEANVPNEQHMVLTVEQYYDLMHHSHPINELEGSDQIAESDKDLKLQVVVLSSKIDECNKTITALQTEVEALKTAINKINQDMVTTEDQNS